jgi:hypothetical protein
MVFHLQFAAGSCGRMQLVETFFKKAFLPSYTCVLSGYFQNTHTAGDFLLYNLILPLILIFSPGQPVSIH